MYGFTITISETKNLFTHFFLYSILTKNLGCDMAILCLRVNMYNGKAILNLCMCNRIGKTTIYGEKVYNTVHCVGYCTLYYTLNCKVCIVVICCCSASSTSLLIPPQFLIPSHTLNLEPSTLNPQPSHTPIPPHTSLVPHTSPYPRVLRLH